MSYIIMRTFFLRLKNLLCVITFFLLLVSCSSTKKIAYFQDLQENKEELVISSEPHDIRLLPGDKISILVNSQDAQLSELFNLPVSARSIGSNTSMGISLYTVDGNGNIEFPLAGTVNVGGKTRKEVADHITKILISHKLLKEPVVTVEFANLSISILGEVKSPGRYSIDRDRLTLLDAIGMAGDLTINGKRDKVFVLRKQDNEQHAYCINLCSAKDLYSSPAYYLQQNDVIYVEPNRVRANQSTINGNSVRSTSFWISLASLAASLISIFR